MRLSSYAGITSLVLSLPSTISALPSVSITPLPSDCSSYPSYNASTNTAGPWEVVADSTDSSFDGYNVSVESFTNDGIDRYGFITLPKQPPRLGTTQTAILRCYSNTLQALLRSSWIDVSIASNENWQSSLSFGLSEAGTRIQPYTHHVNGTRVPGIFLGARNTTGWNYKYNWGGNAGEYYILRLREDGTLVKRQDGFPVLDDRDWVGFLKVVG